MLIANATRFLRESLYSELRKQPCLEIVGDVSEEGAIVAATERSNPDCLIVPLEDFGSAPPICVGILATKPQLRIVAVGEGTNIVAVYWKDQDGEVRCTYTTSSREDILRAIRYPVS